MNQQALHTKDGFLVPRNVSTGAARVQVKDLKEMCKERKIRGYSSMRKSQLVRTLKPILAEEM